MRNSFTCKWMNYDLLLKFYFNVERQQAKMTGNGYSHQILIIQNGEKTDRLH